MQQTQKPWWADMLEEAVLKPLGKHEGKIDRMNRLIALVESRSRADALREAAEVAKNHPMPWTADEIMKVGKSIALSIESLNK